MFKEMLKALFARPADTEPTQVKFYKEAAAFGQHGMIVVSSPKRGLKEVAVPFVFVGMTTPPDLTLEVHKFINSQAYQQGYVPLNIVNGSYGVPFLDKE